MKLRDYNCFCRGKKDSFSGFCYECNLPVIKFIDENLKDDGTLFLGNTGVSNLLKEIHKTLDKVRDEYKLKLELINKRILKLEKKIRLPGENGN